MMPVLKSEAKFWEISLPPCGSWGLSSDCQASTANTFTQKSSLSPYEYLGSCFTEYIYFLILAASFIGLLCINNPSFLKLPETRRSHGENLDQEVKVKAVWYLKVDVLCLQAWRKKGGFGSLREGVFGHSQFSVGSVHVFRLLPYVLVGV